MLVVAGPLEDWAGLVRYQRAVIRDVLGRGEAQVR